MLGGPRLLVDHQFRPPNDTSQRPRAGRAPAAPPQASQPLRPWWRGGSNGGRAGGPGAPTHPDRPLPPSPARSLPTCPPAGGGCTGLKQRWCAGCNVLRVAPGLNGVGGQQRHQPQPRATRPAHPRVAAPSHPRRASDGPVPWGARDGSLISTHPRPPTRGGWGGGATNKARPHRPAGRPGSGGCFATKAICHNYPPSQAFDPLSV